MCSTSGSKNYRVTHGATKGALKQFYWKLRNYNCIYYGIQNENTYAHEKFKIINIFIISHTYSCGENLWNLLWDFEIYPINHIVFNILYNRSHISHSSHQTGKIPAFLGLSSMESWLWDKFKGKLFWDMRTWDRQGTRDAVLTNESLPWVTGTSFHQGNT